MLSDLRPSCRGRQLLLLVTVVTLATFWLSRWLADLPAPTRPLPELYRTAPGVAPEQTIRRPTGPQPPHHSQSAPSLPAGQQPAAAAGPFSQVIQLPADLMPEKTPPPNTTRIILFWNKFYNNADFYVGYGRKPFIGCPQYNCITTSNRSLLAKAEAVVFHMLNEVLPLPPRRPHQRFVFFLKEPPTLSAIREPRYRGVFNLTMTYRRDSDMLANYNSMSDGAEPTPLPAVQNRSKAVAWIVSHCETSSGRELYVDELQRFIDVDVYGKCGPLRCSTMAHGGARHECHRMVAQHYHFYLAFENSQCRDYVTEKLYLPLRYGMVPVVLGDNKTLYEQVAPPDSFIHISDFAGPQQLAEHLQYLMANRTAYLSYLDWRSRYHVEDRTGFCGLCQYLHDRHPAQFYNDIGSWWVDGGACNPEPVIPEPETAQSDSQQVHQRPAIAARDVRRPSVQPHG